MNELYVEMLPERLYNLVGLALSEHAVVYEDAGEVVAHRLVHKEGRHGGVHTAREGADDLLVANPILNVINSPVNDRSSLPIGLAAADIKNKVPEDPVAIVSVHHFGMELQGVELPAGVRHGRKGCVFCMRYDPASRR